MPWTSKWDSAQSFYAHSKETPISGPAPNRRKVGGSPRPGVPERRKHVTYGGSVTTG